MSVLLESAVKVSMVLAVALVAVWLLRRRSAAARHWVLSAGILLAAIAPALQPLAPAWQLRQTPQAREAATAAEIESTAIAALDDTAARNGAVHREPRGQRGRRDAASQSITARVMQSARAMGVRVPQLLIAIWIIGVAISLATLVVGLARLSWLAARARPVRDAKWTNNANDIAQAYGIRRPVTLLHGDRPTLLVTWGWRRPTIMLPTTALRWTDERIQIVLLHELAHVRRHDWPMQIAAALLRALYWFNPLAWIACRQLRQESEQACDDVVLTRGVNAPDYATHLLEFARALTAQRRRDAVLPAQAMARTTGLERRITAMLDVDVNRRALPRSARVAVAAALVALAMPLAGLQLFAQAATARLSGVVTDQSGAPVADAHVDVIDQQTQARRSMTTDNSGRYVFLDLTPGAWRVASEAMGFKPALQGVTLSPGQAATQDLRLEVGSVQETITIGARRDEPGHRPPADEQIVVKMRQAAKAGSLTPPMRTATANPVYPPALMNAGIGDRIVLDARIGTDGSVVDIKVRSSQNPELLKVAMDAVNQWKYTPTLLHGKPVEVEMQVTFDFNPPKPGQK